MLIVLILKISLLIWFFYQGLLEHFEDIVTPIEEQIRILDKGGLFIGYIVPEYEDNIQCNMNG